MARLIGYMANRADRLRDAFHRERDAISGLPAQQRGAWGIGFYQGDEVLHKKQPTPGGEPIDWSAIAENVKTDCAIAHVRQATVGGFSVDNTHPFRLRQWIFAHVGTIGSFEDVRDKLRATLPDFLRRNIRGSSDSELFFHLILAGLHARNQLEQQLPAESSLIEAITDAVREIDVLVGEQRSSTMLNMLLSNGRTMYALRRGGAFGYVLRAGSGEAGEASPERPKPGSPTLRYVMLVSGGHDVPAGYAALPDSTLAIVSHDLEVRSHAL
jgi:predicted glutamine amidotransferase